MITFDRDIVFLDVETLGLARDAPIWEFAAIRVSRTGEILDRTEILIEHDRGGWLDALPEQFRADYIGRYWREFAVRPATAAATIFNITDGTIIAGSNPSFDTQRLERLLADNGLQPGWHFHALDIPSMVVGWMANNEWNEHFDSHLTWKSDALSELTGVLPQSYRRHTAIGDVEWCLAQWQAMTR